MRHAVEAASPSLVDDQALLLPTRTKMQILIAVLLGFFLGPLDQTIVGPALPTIVTQLAGNDIYVWAITIYLLTSTISVPFWGKLSDIHGRKPMFMVGIVIFLIGSAFSGLSQNMTQLVVFRGLQGVGAGSLLPVALAVNGDLFAPAERGKYTGLFGGIFGIAFVVGPLVGGFLTENISWHWIFYVNVPIGLLSLYLIWRFLPTTKNRRKARSFDVLGGLIFTIAIGFLLVGLTQKGQVKAATHVLTDWSDPTVAGFIAIALVGIALFILAESRAKEPIIPLRLFRNRTYTSSMIATFFASFAWFGSIIFLPRWFQIAHGFSPTWSGLAALPLIVGLIGSSILSGRVVARTGRYKWLTVGAIVLLALSTALMTQLRADTPLPIVWLWMFLSGLGVGPTFALFTIIVQNAVPVHDLGVASSNVTFFRQIGGTVALAIVGTIFASSFQEQLAPQLMAAGVPHPIVVGFTEALRNGTLDFNKLTGVGDFGKTIVAAQPSAAPVVGTIVAGIHQAFSLGVAQIFGIGVIAAILAVLAAAGMQEIPLRRRATRSMAKAVGTKAARSLNDKDQPRLPAAD